ncbi:uncharacterized protein LOC127705381 [Mytilus californianus]|uniref:uncharacterized protein LOC127705381 n=1 Tax=Mytilus californianus TaxID=6549 RepID=UPI002246D334|nr:uncharacterized protein LOC127705381 [Mytilus californianus]
MYFLLHHCQIMDKFPLGSILFCLYLPIQVLAVDEYTKCSNASVSENLPVATFCTNSEAEGERIVLDGYFANTIPDKVCSCVAQRGQAQKIVFSNVNFLQSSIQSGGWCGSKIIAKQDNGQSNHMSCRVVGSLDLQDNNHIQISLRKESAPEDTRYCALVYFDTDEPIKISCFSNYVATTSGYETSISTTNPPTMISSYSAETTTVDMLKETSSTLTSQHVTVTNSILMDTITPPVSTSHMDLHTSTKKLLTENATVVIETTETNVSVDTSTKESTTQTDVHSDTTPSTVRMTTKIKTTVSPEPTTTIVNEQTVDDKNMYIGIGVGCGALVIFTIILIGAKIWKKHLTSKGIELKSYLHGEDNEYTTVNVTHTSANIQRNGINYTNGTHDTSSKHKPEFTERDEYKSSAAKHTDVPRIKPVENLYAVVDKSKKKQLTDSVIGGVKDHTAAEKTLKTSQKPETIAPDTANNGLQYAELEFSHQPSNNITDKPNITSIDSVDYAEVMFKK